MNHVGRIEYEVFAASRYQQIAITIRQDIYGIDGISFSFLNVHLMVMVTAVTEGFYCYKLSDLLCIRVSRMH